MICRCSADLARHQADISMVTTYHGGNKVFDRASHKPAAFVRLPRNPIPPALMFSRHLGSSMTKLLLHIPLVDVRRGGEAAAQRVTGEFESTFDFCRVATNAGGHDRTLDQAGDLLVVQTVRADLFALPGHAAEEGTMGKFGEFDPGFECCHRAGGIAGAAADFDSRQPAFPARSPTWGRSSSEASLF